MIALLQFENISPNYSTTTIPTLYQPPPPKGIAIISGNIIWSYNNSTATIIIFNATSNSGEACTVIGNWTMSNCAISVMQGQKIELATLRINYLVNGTAFGGAFNVTTAEKLYIVTRGFPPP